MTSQVRKSRIQIELTEKQREQLSRAAQTYELPIFKLRLEELEERVAPCHHFE